MTGRISISQKEQSSYANQFLLIKLDNGLFFSEKTNINQPAPGQNEENYSVTIDDGRKR